MAHAGISNIERDYEKGGGEEGGVGGGGWGGEYGVSDIEGE